MLGVIFKALSKHTVLFHEYMASSTYVLPHGCRFLLAYASQRRQGSTFMTPKPFTASLSKTRTASTEGLQSTGRSDFLCISLFNGLQSRNSFDMLLFGPGLLSTSGVTHKKQRKMLNPLFSGAHMRNLTPIFLEVSRKVRALIPLTCSLISPHSHVLF